MGGRDAVGSVLLNKHLLEGVTCELSLEGWLGANCVKGTRTKKAIQLGRCM